MKSGNLSKSSVMAQMAALNPSPLSAAAWPADARASAFAGTTSRPLFWRWAITPATESAAVFQCRGLRVLEKLGCARNGFSRPDVRANTAMFCSGRPIPGAGLNTRALPVAI